VSQKRCGMLPARSSNVSRRGVIHRALACATRGGCGGGRSPFDKSLGRATFTFVLCHRKRVQQGILPCRGFGGILGAFNSPLQALSRDGVRLRRTRVRGVPESSYHSPKSGGRGLIGSHEAAWRAGAQEATSPFRAKWRPEFGSALTESRVAPVGDSHGEEQQ
jgi:hypothetical protein